MKTTNESLALAASSERKRFRLDWRRSGLLLVLIALCVWFSILSPVFFSVQNIINTLQEVAVYGMLALGGTFVILTGGIDLSVGSIVSFTGVLAAVLDVNVWHNSILAVLVGLAGGAIVGLINGVLVAYLKIQPFIVTLGMLSVIQAFALIVSNGEPIQGYTSGYASLGTGAVAGVPYAVWVFIIATALAWILLSLTRFGRYVYATGGNESAAMLAGVGTQRVKFTVYVISGFLAAVGGILLTTEVGTAAPTAGQNYELNAIAAVVVGGASLFGGRGSIAGTILGVLILGVVADGLNLTNVNSVYQILIVGLIIIASVALNQVAEHFKKARK